MIVSAEVVVARARAIDKMPPLGANRGERLVAITHGDPQSPEHCGRPLWLRDATVEDTGGASAVYVCPVHGDLKETNAFGDGRTGAFAFFAADRRARQVRE